MCAHEAVTNECIKPGCTENPKTMKLRRVLQAASLYTLCFGVGLSVLGRRMNSAASIADGAHAATDLAATVGHGIANVQEGSSTIENLANARRKVMLTRLATAALIGVGTVYSGYHAVEAIQNPDHVAFSNTLLAAEATAAVGSLVLRAGVRKYDDGSLGAQDAERHFTNDLLLSVGAAGSILLTRYGVESAQPVLADMAQPTFAGVATLMTGRLAWQTATGNDH